MEKRYISVDVETSGRTPGKHSMLSLGACIVDNPSVNFYREIQPISPKFVLDAMKVSVKGLKCLEKYRSLSEFDPSHKNFNPDRILDVLYQEGENPFIVMADFAYWIQQNTRGYKVVEVAAPIKFDGMFTAWYFDNFYPKENPFGHNGIDMTSMYRGIMKNEDVRLSDLGIRGKDLPHNALEDCIIQAKEFRKVLELMKE